MKITIEVEPNSATAMMLDSMAWMNNQLGQPQQVAYEAIFREGVEGRFRELSNLYDKAKGYLEIDTITHDT